MYDSMFIHDANTMFAKHSRVNIVNALVVSGTRIRRFARAIKTCLGYSYTKAQSNFDVDYPSGKDSQVNVLVTFRFVFRLSCWCSLVLIIMLLLCSIPQFAVRAN